MPATLASVTAADLTVDFTGHWTGSSWSRGLLSNVDRVYGEHGCFLARNVIGREGLATLHAHIGRLIDLRRRHAGLEPVTSRARFDDGFRELCRVNRAHGGVIYDACKRLNSVHDLAADPRFGTLSAHLMKSDLIMSYGGYQGLRIDHPGESQYLFPWHQDFPFMQSSMDGLIYWIPLQDVDESSGCLEVVPGSHRLGIMPVKAKTENFASGKQSQSLDIADLSPLDDLPHVRVPCRAGDVLIFNMLLAHRSRESTSEHVRWTAQVRHGNFSHADAIARDWPAGIIGGTPFPVKFPEFVINS